MTDETGLAHVAAVTEHPNVLGTLGINGMLFAAQLVNITLVLLALRLWVFKPLVKMLEERRVKIEKGVADAALADTRLAEATQQESTIVAAAQAEAYKTVEEARAAGEAERKSRVEQAMQEIDRQIVDAKDRIQTERVQAAEAVRRETAALVLAATEKVAGVALDDAAHARDIERALAELESGARAT